MEKQTNQAVLLRMISFFGIAISALLALIFEKNYFGLDKLNNKSFEILEVIIFLFSTGAYLRYIWLYTPYNLRFLLTQGVLIIFILISGFYQEERLGCFVHLTSFGLFMLLCILYELWLRPQKKVYT
jgi:hypothetical protein